MAFTNNLSEVRSKDLAQVGGKAASLGELIAAPFPVPPGFVVTAATFEHCLAQHPRRSDIDSQLAAVNLDDMNSVDRAANVIRDIILDLPIPTAVVDEVLTQTNQLDGEFFAVRSSATAEDSAVASWAGELDTFLNTQREQIIPNMKLCWASLFTPRAIFYRLENELREAQVSVAVVVQQMVASDVSGVCFTVHPVTKDPNHLIIEAGLGLGEAVVAGLITPDSYVVAKDSLAVIDSQINLQRLMLKRGKNGATQRHELADNQGGRQKLTPDQITELAQMAIAVERHYGFPVDIEWAIADSQLILTQARPITTL
jgi:pyruvate,water dikinase